MSLSSHPYTLKTEAKNTRINIFFFRKEVKIESDFIINIKAKKTQQLLSNAHLPRKHTQKTLPSLCNFKSWSCF